MEELGRQLLNMLSNTWDSNTHYQINHSPLFQACDSPGHCKTNTSVYRSQEWENKLASSLRTKNVFGWCVNPALAHPSAHSLPHQCTEVAGDGVARKQGRVSFQNRSKNLQLPSPCILQ